MQFKYMYQQQPSQVCFGKSCSTYSKKVGAPSLQNWRFNTEHQKIDFRLGGWFSWDIFHFVRGAVFRSTWCSAKVDFTKSQLYHGPWVFFEWILLNNYFSEQSWWLLLQKLELLLIRLFLVIHGQLCFGCFSWFSVDYGFSVRVTQWKLDLTEKIFF